MTQTRRKPAARKFTEGGELDDGQMEAILYCRVSDKSQVERGHGLDSPEVAGREYSERKGYRIIAVFCDDLTGSTAKRPGIKEMLALLKSRRRRGTRVIIDHGNRIARGLRPYYEVRDAITAVGGKVEDTTGKLYTDDPDDDFTEIINAAVAGEQRRQNAEQTMRRMRARCLGGNWCLQLPYGYKYRLKQSKKDPAVIERHEPVATIIQEALEGYASGFLTTQADVARFLASHPQFPKMRNGRVSDDMAKRTLTNPLYAGYVSVPEWDVSLRPGNHPALISFETFRRIQRRLQGGSKGIVRKDNSADFVLRGFAVCGCCRTRLTAYWAKGSHGRYAYYHCREKTCAAYARSIPRAKIEGEFAELLKNMQPSHALFGMVDQALRTLWKQRGERAADDKRSLTAEIRAVDGEIQKLVDRVLETNTSSMIAAYERRIVDAEARKVELTEKLANCGKPLADFDSAFRTAMVFLGSPYKLWASGRFDLKQMILKLAFAGQLEYVRESGFRTPETTLPFKVLANFSASKAEMARPERFERPTLRFVV